MAQLKSSHGVLGRSFKILIFTLCTCLSFASVAQTLEEAKLAIRIRDFDQAQNILRKLSQQNDPQAQFLLASMYMRSDQISQDIDQAFHWYTLAAQQNHGLAQYNLANLYERGKGVDRELQIALNWYQKALQNGVPKAQAKITKLQNNANLQVQNKQQARLKLFRTLNQQKISTARQLLKHYDLANSVDNKGYSALMLAIDKDYEDGVKLLLQEGADPEYFTQTGYTPLMLAVEKQAGNLIVLLVTDNVSLNHQDNAGNTALIYAVRTNNLGIVKILLRAGADPNIQNNGHKSALNFAKEGSEIATLLNSFGGNDLHTKQPFDVLSKNLANFNSEEFKNNPYHDWPPLNIAAWRGKLDIVTQLLNDGAAVNKTDPKGYTALMRASWQGYTKIAQHLINHSADINKQLIDGRTAVYLAVQSNHLEIVNLLLQYKAQITVPAKTLEPLVILASRQGLQDIAIKLLDAGASANTLYEGSSALHFSAGAGLFRLTQALLMQGIDINQLNNHGQSPLLLAASNNHPDIIDLLLTYNGQTESKDQDGNTPLLLACKLGMLDVATMLVEHKANIEASNSQLNRPIHLAASNGHTKIIDYLLQQGANIQQRNKGSYTPLMLGAMNGHLPLVKILVSQGAQISRRNKNGLTAYDLALQAKQHQVAEYLHKQADNAGFFDIFN